MSMAVSEEILRKIPHRPPFLWVDRIISVDNETLLAEKYIPPDLDIFAGHYPGQPVMPGVLVCEAIFQAGALLLAETGMADSAADRRVPMLTRIFAAKFKRPVHPGDTMELSAAITEKLGGAWLMKGRARVDGKVSVIVEFAVTLAEGQ